MFEANYVSRDGANLVGAVIDYGVVLEADGAPVTQHVHWNKKSLLANQEPKQTFIQQQNPGITIVD